MEEPVADRPHAEAHTRGSRERRGFETTFRERAGGSLVGRQPLEQRKCQRRQEPSGCTQAPSGCSPMLRFGSPANVHATTLLAPPPAIARRENPTWHFVF